MPRETLKHQAYNIIKEKIINCEYAPEMVINEELIQKEISVSRTPIRDALSRLEQEGLVKILPKKGIYIPNITLDEINMLYEARHLIEPYSVQHYGNKIPKETYMNYFRQYETYLNKPSETAYSFEEMDDKFHRMFIDASENSYFLSLYTAIESQIRRTRVLTGIMQKGRLKPTVEEHMTIVKATLKGNWAEAADALRYHLSQSKDIIFDYILQQSN